MPNPMQMIQNLLPQLKQNPMQFLAQRKLYIPRTCAGDPQSIINYLVQSGQVPQDAYNEARQLVQQMQQQMQQQPQRPAQQ